MQGDADKIEELLRTAIKREEESNALYTQAAKMVKSAPSRVLLEELAAEELTHKAKLEDLLAGGVKWVVRGYMDKVTDLKISDYLVAQPLREDADFQDVLAVAAKREKNAYDFYTAVSEVAQDQAVKNLFAWLANEEMKHKQKVETLYEETVYKEF